MRVLTAAMLAAGGEAMTDTCAPAVATNAATLRVPVVALLLMMILVALIGVAVLLCVLLAMQRSAAPKPTAPEGQAAPLRRDKRRFEDKASQSQCTYRRKWTTPRFDMLRQDLQG